MGEPVSTDNIAGFMDSAGCVDCKRDADETCPILATAFRAWPQEWKNGRCSMFWPEGQPEPTQHCTHTMELPLE